MVLSQQDTREVPKIQPNKERVMVPEEFPRPGFPMQNKENEPSQRPRALPLPDPMPFSKTQSPQKPIQETSNRELQIPAVTQERQREEGYDTKALPLFVRIDKFKETKEHFEAIYHKIEDMEKILRSLEVAKTQEDQEIDAWKQDIEEMRSLLSTIDKEVFSKV